MDNYVADGYRLEKGDFTEDEKKISLRSEKIYNDNKIELNEGKEYLTLDKLIIIFI